MGKITSELKRGREIRSNWVCSILIIPHVRQVRSSYIIGPLDPRQWSVKRENPRTACWVLTNRKTQKWAKSLPLMLVFNCTMSKKGSSYGTCCQRGMDVCRMRNGKVREEIIAVLVYTLVCESEKVRLPVSKNVCVWEGCSAEKYKGRQRPISNCYEKEWGWGIVHSPFLASAVKNK